MNTNQKKLKLVMEGIKASTLNKMTDSQVDVLFSKLQEQVTEVPGKKTYKVGPAGGKVGNLNITQDPSTKEVMVTATESEIDEDADLDDSAEKDSGFDPYAGNSVGNNDGPSKDDGFGGGYDGMGMMEEKEIDEKFESKKQQKYFFAKCGDGKTKEQKKWCKMADEFAEKTNFAKLPEKKKETKEEFGMGDYNKKIASVVSNLHMKNLDQTTTPNVEIFGESEIEKHIMRLVEKHITPKMSKKDFNNLLEGDTKTAPAKPKVSPGTKPKHPFQPDPDKKGAPKAMKKEVDEGTEVAPAKPKVSPGTTPKHPFAPDPSKQGAPKAIKRELPSFLKFNELGLKTK